MAEKNQFIPREAQEEYLQAYLNVMKLWKVEYQSLEVETSFGTTHINFCGSKDNPPLLLLHAASVSSAEWYANVKELSKDFYLIAPDTIGDCGWSRCHAEMENRDHYNQWLMEIMDHLHLEKSHIMGHSYGGWLALNLAISHPEKLDKMVLLAPAASLAPFNLIIKMALKMPRLPLMPSAEKTLKMMAAKDFEPPIEFVELMDVVNRHFKPKMVFPTVYSDPELQNIKNPTLLLMGDQEKIYPPLKAVKRARKLIPNVKSEIIIDAGHILNMEKPEEVNSRVIKFLKSE
ncbi:alpha/beta hydrolase [Methanobacterium alkalithermotolerans]|uniref:Alpha/beta hydrolase n=1 Tax=Methanobacterium alkalithermotolerans TaxID=2731220 RepID=A0A8T8K890_9EURY|nr:alpha/beta hydrolase [Methanobacterium alkalithermotolerans]QUH23785.1 alpha/beta hydrolase [Methanobacterium alkalithermotolerans]